MCKEKKKELLEKAGSEIIEKLKSMLDKCKDGYDHNTESPGFVCAYMKQDKGFEIFFMAENEAEEKKEGVSERVLEMIRHGRNEMSEKIPSFEEFMEMREKERRENREEETEGGEEASVIEQMNIEE